MLTLAIGYWASKRVKNSRDFTLAGRNLSTSFVGVTLFATWFGSSQIMGIPGQVVEYGLSSFVTLIFTASLVLFLIGRYFARQLYSMNIVTISDFFRIRYNGIVERVVSVLMVLSYPAWIAAQYVALAYLLQTVFGIPLSQGIFLGAAFVMLYTYIGGMWAVSYTDMVQSVIIVFGLTVILLEVLDQTGDLVPMVMEKPPEYFSPFPENNLVSWSGYIALILAFTLGQLPIQEVYQRVFSARSEKAAVKGLYLGALLMLVLPIIPMLIAFAGANLNPDLMFTDHGQAIIPAIVTNYASVPVQVLFYGAIISAILSTSSGAMLAPATVIGENLIKPYLPDISDRKLLIFTRFSVVAVAGISCYFALNDSDIVGLVAASLSLILVCVSAPFLFGFFWKRASVTGAYIAIILGAVIWFGCYLNETQIDPTIYGTAASHLGMIVGSFYRPDVAKIDLAEKIQE